MTVARDEKTTEGGSDPPDASSQLSPSISGSDRDPQPVYEASVAEAGLAAAIQPLELDLAQLVRWAAYATLLIIAAGVVGFAASARRADVFAAQTEIFFPLDADRGTGFLREDRRISTQLESIRSRAVLAPVAAAYDLEIRELEDMLSAGIVGASEIILIEARSEDPELALALVTTVSDTYLAQLIDSGVEAARALLAAEQASLDARDREIEKRLDVLEIAARSLVAGAVMPDLLQQELSLLIVDRAELQVRETDLLRRITTFEVEQALLPQPTVLATPYALTEPISPNKLFDMAVAMALGAMLAAVLIGILLVRAARQARRR